MARVLVVADVRTVTARRLGRCVSGGRQVLVMRGVMRRRGYHTGALRRVGRCMEVSLFVQAIARHATHMNGVRKHRLSAERNMLDDQAQRQPHRATHLTTRRRTPFTLAATGAALALVYLITSANDGFTARGAWVVPAARVSDRLSHNGLPFDSRGWWNRLAAGYDPAARDVDAVIVTSESRVGDNWRRRWDSLRLFYSRCVQRPSPNALSSARSSPGIQAQSATRGDVRAFSELGLR